MPECIIKRQLSITAACWARLSASVRNSLLFLSSMLHLFSWGLKFRCIRVDVDRHAVDKRERLARREKNEQLRAGIVLWGWWT